MSISVRYLGQTVQVSCAPMTPMQEVLERAAEAHSVKQSTSRYGLWHKQSEVDLSQPFRFTGLANKVTLEMKQKSVKSKVAAATPVTLAISVQGAGSVVETFPAEMTLSGVLATLVCGEKLAEDILSADPALQYFGKSYSNEMLETTTLASLGLSGQQVRMQLRHTLIPNTTGASSGTSSSSSPKKEFKPVTNFFKSMGASMGFGKKKSDDDGAPSSSSSSSSSEGMNSDWTSSMKRPVDSQSVFRSGSGNRLGDGPGATASTSIRDNRAAAAMDAGGAPPSPSKTSVSAPSLAPMDVQKSQREQSKEVPMELQQDPGKEQSKEVPMEVEGAPPHGRIGPFVPRIEASRNGVLRVMQMNEKSLAHASVSTLTKYLENIVKNPLEVKYRTIKMTNKVFKEKISGATGAVEFLYSVGFEPVTKGEVEVLVVQAPNIEHLEGALHYLQNASTSLEADLKFGANTNSSAPAPSSVSTSSADFDPFKAQITRNAKQPERGESTTERQLDTLQKRRIALQGSIDAVERQTRVIPIGSPGSNSLPDVSPAWGDSAEDDRADRKLQAASVANQIRDFGKAQDKPLTTKAVRDLEKAKKEKVFMKTLLKVRFPDGMQIQGYFHPQDTIESVSNWISCCFCDAWTFEVFTAPPKNVLFNNRVDSKSHKKTQDAPSTLEQLGFVPAAILNVDWLGQERPVSDVPGCYLMEQLLLGIESGSEEMATGESLYPQGKDLVPSAGTAKAGSSQSSVKAEAKSASSSSESSRKSGGGPKWMKL